jgi:protein-S-isoprenylcysteine O-methyltransferase Ste14
MLARLLINGRSRELVDAKRSVVMSAVAGPLFIIAIVFITAGTFNYWQGLLYTALTMAVLVVSFLSIRKNKELINERIKPGEGTKSWDKIYWRISSVLFFVTLILACLDGGRFNWSPALPFAVYIIAIGLYLLGNFFVIWAITTNSFFSSVVRIQKDRGQTVCQEGPYKYVRHPGYLGGLLYTLVTPLLLGSLWAMIPVVMNIILMIIRTSLEDKTLEAELSGYRDYKEKVKFRILPHVW